MKTKLSGGTSNAQSCIFANIRYDLQYKFWKKGKVIGFENLGNATFQSINKYYQF